MPKRRASLIATAVAGLALAISASPASAASLVHDDPPYDGRVFAGLDGDAEAAIDPGITQVRIDHRKKRLTIAITLSSDVNWRAFESVGFVSIIKTPKSRLALNFGKSTWGSHKYLYRSGRAVKCKGMTAKFIARTGVAQASIPTKCIGHPRRVKVGAELHADFGDHNEIYDNGFGPFGHVGETRLSRWVRRG